MDREELKVVTEIKVLGKRGDYTNAKILAKEVVRSRKAKSGMITSKARLNSIGMQLGEQLATVKVAGCLQSSAQIMQMMNQLIRLPQIHETMRVMAREMEQSGLISEMTDEMLSGLDSEDIEEEAEGEVDKVFSEIVGKLPGVGKDKLNPQQVSEDDPELVSRIAALKNTPVTGT